MSKIAAQPVPGIPEICNLCIVLPDEGSEATPGTLALAWMENLVTHPDDKGKEDKVERLEAGRRLLLRQARAVFRLLQPAAHEAMIAQLDRHDPTTLERFGEAVITAAYAHDEGRTREAEFQEAIGIDPTTGALTKRGLTRWLHEHLGLGAPGSEVEERRARQGLGIYYLDLMRFKEVNDTLGHHMGDHVLAAAVAEMRQLLRGNEAIARDGGDEFIVVIPGITAENGESILRRLSEHQLRKIEDDQYRTLWETITALAAQETSFEVTNGLLYANGEIIADLRSLAISAIGYTYGEVSAVDDIDRLKVAADKNMYAHKRKLGKHFPKK